MSLRAINFLVCCLLALFSGQSTADNELTKTAPTTITIEADQAQFDERAGSSTYSGHVLLQQDKVRIQADQLSVISRDGHVEKLTASGTPVSFHQQATENNSAMEGEALRIEFYAPEQKIFLLDKARLRQGGSEFSGDRIEYDVDKQTISANALDPKQDRVRVTIVPQQTPKSDEAKDSAPDPSTVIIPKKP